MTKVQLGRNPMIFTHDTAGTTGVVAICGNVPPTARGVKQLLEWLDLVKEEIAAVVPEPDRPCHDCSRTEAHVHCNECGDVSHSASTCDMLG